MYWECGKNHFPELQCGPHSPLKCVCCKYAEFILLNIIRFYLCVPGKKLNSTQNEAVLKTPHSNRQWPVSISNTHPVMILRTLAQTKALCLSFEYVNH